MRRFASRFKRDAAGNLSTGPIKPPHCAYCGASGDLRSMKVRGAGRLDVCETCRVNRLGFPAVQA